MKALIIFLCFYFAFAAEIECDKDGGSHLSEETAVGKETEGFEVKTEPALEKKPEAEPEEKDTLTAVQNHLLEKPATVKHYFNRRPWYYQLPNNDLINGLYDSRYRHPLYPEYERYNDHFAHPLYPSFDRYPLYERPLYMPYGDTNPYYTYPLRDHIPFSYRYRQAVA